MADSIPSRRLYEGPTGGWSDGRLGQAYDIVSAVRADRSDQPNLKRVLGRLLDEIEHADEELRA